MDKMRMETPDLTAANVEKIGALFPNCITETTDENGKPKKAINFPKYVNGTFVPLPPLKEKRG